MRRTSAVRNCEGFTLLETLAALTIAVLLISVTAAGWMRVLRAGQQAARLHEGSQALWTAASALLRGDSPGEGPWIVSERIRRPKETGDPAWLELTLKPPGEEDAPPVVHFFLRSPADPAAGLE